MRTVARFSVLVLLLTLTGAAAALAAGVRPAAAPKRPVVKAISPTTVEPSERINVRGSGFVKGRKNKVLFLGGPGKADNKSIRAMGLGKKRLTLRAPRARITVGGSGAVSGLIQVINRYGKSRRSAKAIRFDNDSDGLTNESELRRGTSPVRSDTDGDGVRDGMDSDPLNPPDDPGQPSPPPPPPPGTPTCTGPAVSGSGVASSFAGFNFADGRFSVAHAAYTGSGFRSFCLKRKLRGQGDSAYQVVGTSTNPAAGTIKDGQAAAHGVDYLYRTDTVTDAGLVVGSTPAAARGVGLIAALPNWLALDQVCTNNCGSASIGGNDLGQPTPAVLATGVAGTGSGTAGSMAVFQHPVRGRVRIAGAPGEIYARVVVPDAPTAAGSYVAAALSLSDQHPVSIDTGSAFGDVFASARPWVTIELRRFADGSVRVVVLDSASIAPGKVVGQTADLRVPDGAGGLDTPNNVFIKIDPIGAGSYEARYKTNLAENPGDPSGDFTIDLDGAGLFRPIPGGLTTAWLSLAGKVSGADVAAHTVRFDEALVQIDPGGPGASDYDLDSEGFAAPYFVAPPPPPPPPAP